MNRGILVARATLITAGAIGVVLLGLQAFVVSQIPLEPQLCTPPLEYSSDLVYEEGLWFLGVFCVLPTVVWTAIALRRSRSPAREVDVTDAWVVLVAVGIVAAWCWSFCAMALLTAVYVNLPEGLCEPSALQRAGTLGVFLLALPLAWAVSHLGMLAHQRRI